MLFVQNQALGLRRTVPIGLSEPPFPALGPEVIPAGAVLLEASSYEPSSHCLVHLHP